MSRRVLILFIPSVLAYGKRSQGESIGPGENRCFDIRVTDVFTENALTKKNTTKLPVKKKKKK